MNSVIIPAGGSGSRFSDTQSKLLIDFKGSSIIEQNVSAFINHHLIDEIILVCPKEQLQVFKSKFLKIRNVIITPGGSSRADSVKNGFNCVSKDASKILIHDGARPNITKTLISNVLNELNHHPVIIPGIPVTDTLKKVENNIIVETINRATCVAVQTPQGFTRDVLSEAYSRISDIQLFTDEAGLVEHIGIQGKVIAGDKNNIKITHPNDMNYLNFISSL